MNRYQMFILGSASMLLLFSSLFGLWDITRHQLELKTGYYDLPFGYTVPWWWAGDLFVAFGLGSMVLVWLIVLRRKR